MRSTKRAAERSRPTSSRQFSRGSGSPIEAAAVVKPTGHELLDESRSRLRETTPHN